MQVVDTRIVRNRRDRARARSAAAAPLALAVVVGFGCASAGVTPVDRALESTVARPSVMLVYDFAVMPGDVVVDTFGSEFERELSKEEQEAHATASLRYR